VNLKTGTPCTRYLFSADEYHRLSEAGLFTEDDPVELLNGEIIIMSPIGIKHASMVNRLNRLFNRLLRDRTIISIQNPLALATMSEPEPDLMLLKPREDCYAEQHPRPEDVLLLIEVSDTTLGYDQEKKIPAYANAGISEVWLIDVQAQTLTSYTEPQPSGSYAKLTQLSSDTTFAPHAFPEAALQFSDLGW
jgi:Uma2 family endonuclease